MASPASTMAAKAAFPPPLLHRLAPSSPAIVHFHPIKRYPNLVAFSFPRRNPNPYTRLPSLRPPASAAAAASAAAEAFFSPVAAAVAGEGAAASARPAVAAALSALARWLELYQQVLTVRVLLTWFPNLPWDRQPFSALRDLCDPFLSIFREVMPPIKKKLDVSPLIAFPVLDMIVKLLKFVAGVLA